ncbi:MAG: hypothetical protein U7126_27845 [Microcoleus sp.]
MLSKRKGRKLTFPSLDCFVDREVDREVDRFGLLAVFAEFAVAF